MTNAPLRQEPEISWRRNCHFVVRGLGLDSLSAHLPSLSGARFFWSLVCGANRDVGFNREASLTRRVVARTQAGRPPSSVRKDCSQVVEEANGAFLRRNGIAAGVHATKPVLRSSNSPAWPHTVPPGCSDLMERLETKICVYGIVLLPLPGMLRPFDGHMHGSATSASLKHASTSL